MVGPSIEHFPLQSTFDLDTIYPSLQSTGQTAPAKMVHIANGEIEEEDHPRNHRWCALAKTENVQFSRMERVENCL